MTQSAEQHANLRRSDDGDIDAYVIPKWFIWFLSIFMSVVTTFALPWAGWVTNKLIRIDERTDSLVRNNTTFSTHLEDRSIHHSAISAMEVRLELIEQRLNRMEKP